MRHTFHCHLNKSFLWYRNWHSHPFHKHTHWLSFLAGLYLAGSLVSGQITIFYKESELATHQAQAQAAPLLGRSGDRFTVNGQPRFLALASYFDALDASNLNSDLDYLKARGMDGIRIFPVWFEQFGPTIENSSNVYDGNGNLNSSGMSRLRAVLDAAAARSMIVDISFTCVEETTTSDSCTQGIRNTVTSLGTSYPHIFYDLQNEWDQGPDGSGRFQNWITEAQAKSLRDYIKNNISSSIIVTTSLTFGDQDAIDFASRNLMDAVNYHDSRTTDWYSQTESRVASMGSRTNLPIYFGEPERWTPGSTLTSGNFVTAITGAKKGCAAAWTFHNEASFVLNSSTLASNFSQVETDFLNTFKSSLDSTTWCSSSPGPTGGGTPTALYCSEWLSSGGTAACGCYIGSGTGQGTKWQTVKNAMNAEVATGNWTGSTDIAGFKDAVVARLNSSGEVAARGNNGNCNQSANNLAIQTSTVNGIMMAEMYEIARDGAGCNGEIPATVDNATSCRPLDAYVGSWDFVGLGNAPTSCSTACSLPPPTPISTPKPRYIYFINPDSAQIGQTVVVYGDNLSNIVQFTNSANQRYSFVGIINTDLTQLTITLPSELSPGIYTVRVGSDPTVDVSNGTEFTVLPGTFDPEPTAADAPIILGFTPQLVIRGNTIEIFGDSLTPNVQFFNSTGQITTTLGWTSEDLTLVTVQVPASLVPGVYTVGIVGPSGSAVSPDPLSVLDESGIEPQGVGDFLLPAATNFQNLISNIYNYAIYVVGVAVFIMIMWAGFLWMTSAANPGNIATAKRMITNAILGAILLLSSYVILYTINPDLVGRRLDLPGITGILSPTSVIIQPTCDNGFCSNDSALACTQNTDCNVVCIDNACINGITGSCTYDTDCQIFPRFIVENEDQAADAFAVGCARVAGVGYQDFTAIECPSSSMPLALDPIISIEDSDANQQVNTTVVHSGGNTGQGRRIVVLDTGYNRNHPELSSSYLDGWDFINNDNDPDDDHTGGIGSPGHGSHVAGIITADGNDPRARGAAPGAQIIAGKILDSRGRGNYSTLVTAIYWAINGPDNRFGTSDDFKPDVISISIGGGTYTDICDNNDSTTREIKKAIEYARDHDTLVVIAAGNNSNGISMPGCIDKSFTVGAVDSNDAIANFSGRGAGLDIVAPGVNIYSSLLGTSYGTKSGTSMATPIVSGIAALIKAAYPNYTVDQLERALINSARDLGSAGKDIFYGWGRVSAAPGQGGNPPPPCSSGCASIIASPASCTRGTVSSNPNCNININYSISNIPLTNLVIRRIRGDGFSQIWTSISSNSGSQAETDPSPGRWTFAIVNESTQATLASTTVNIYYQGDLDSPWLSCTKGADVNNPNCDIAISYSVGNATGGNVSIYRDGSSWQNITPPNGTITDPNPSIGTHTYTLRDNTGSNRAGRLVIKIEAAAQPARIISSLSVNSARAGQQVTIDGSNLGNQLEIARRYFTVQLHDNNRVRYTSIGVLNPNNSQGVWTVTGGNSPIPPGDYTLRVGPTLDPNDVSNEVNFTVLP